MIHLELEDEQAVEILKWLEEKQYLSQPFNNLKNQLERLILAKAKRRSNGTGCISEKGRRDSNLPRT